MTNTFIFDIESPAFPFEDSLVWIKDSDASGQTTDDSGDAWPYHLQTDFATDDESVSSVSFGALAEQFMTPIAVEVQRGQVQGVDSAHDYAYADFNDGIVVTPVGSPCTFATAVSSPSATTNRSKKRSRQDSFSSSSSTKARKVSIGDDSGKKTGRWTDEECKAFLRGLQKHGKGNWSVIAKEIPTR